MARAKAKNPATMEPITALPAAEAFLQGQQPQSSPPPPPPAAPAETVVGAIRRETVTKDSLVLAPTFSHPAQAPMPLNGNRYIPPHSGNKAQQIIDDLGQGKIAPEENWMVRVDKLTPFKPLGSSSIPQGTVTDIKAALAASEGAGLYLLKLSKGGVDCTGIDWQIRMTVTPDDIPFRTNIQKASSGEDSLDEEIQRTEKTVALVRKKGELKKTQAEVDREEQRLRDDDARRVTAPIETMREEMRTFMQGMKDIVAAQTQALSAARPQLDIVALLTALSPLFMEVIRGKKEGPDLEKLIVLLNSTNKENMQAVMQAVKEKPQDESMMKMLFKDVILKRITEEKNPLDELVKMKRLLEEFNPPPQDDDIEIDPNNITGSLFAQGIAGLIRAFRSGGAKELLTAVAQGVGKPAEQVTDTDIAMLAHERPELLHQVNPQPGSIRKLPPPMVHAQAKVSEDARKAEQQIQSASDSPVAPQIPLSVDEGNGIPSRLPESTVGEEIKDAPQAPTNTDMQQDLAYEINASVHEMIIDIRAARTEYQWVYNAVNRWHRAYLDELSALPGDTDKMKSVRSKSDPELWKKVDQALQETGGSAYSYFFSSFGVLTSLHTEGKQIETQQQPQLQPDSSQASTNAAQ